MVKLIDNIEYIKIQQYSDLHVAIAKKDFEQAKLLIENDPEIIRHKDKERKNALLFVLSRGYGQEYFDLAKFMMEKNPEAILDTDQSGVNTLQYLSSFATIEIDLVKLAIEKQPEAINTLSLYKASDNLGEDIIKLIIEKQPNAIKEVNQEFGDTALHNAIRYNNYKMIEILAPEYKKASCINIQNKNGNTPLQMATKHWSKDNIKTFKILIENGANITELNVKDQQGYKIVDHIQNSETKDYLKKQGVEFSGFFRKTYLIISQIARSIINSIITKFNSIFCFFSKNKLFEQNSNNPVTTIQDKSGPYTNLGNIQSQQISTTSNDHASREEERQNNPDSTLNNTFKH